MTYHPNYEHILGDLDKSIENEKNAKEILKNNFISYIDTIIKLYDENEDQISLKSELIRIKRCFSNIDDADLFEIDIPKYTVRDINVKQTLFLLYKNMILLKIIMYNNNDSEKITTFIKYSSDVINIYTRSKASWFLDSLNEGLIFKNIDITNMFDKNTIVDNTNIFPNAIDTSTEKQ